MKKEELLKLVEIVEADEKTEVALSSATATYVRPRTEEYVQLLKANGNNVDAETEANNILQIQMQYRLLTHLTNFEFSQVNAVMKK